MKEIIIILACLPLYVINAFCDKYASTQSTSFGNSKYNTVKFALGSLILLPMLFFDSLPKLALGAIISGALCGIMYAIGKTAILKGYEQTSVSFMTLCHSAGMIIPCIVGHFIWSEKLGLVSLFGVVLTIASVVLLKDGKKTGKRLTLKGALCGLAVFLSSGGVMITQKMMGIYFSEQSVSAYNFYSFASCATILLACMAVSEKKKKASLFAPTKATSSKSIKIKITLCALGSAVALCLISLVMTGLAGAVPSVILFPMFNGSGIILVCIGSIFVFKEKMSVKQIIGLLVGVAGLCVINI